MARFDFVRDILNGVFKNFIPLKELSPTVSQASRAVRSTGAVGLKSK
jgi:hypothetical protein